MNLAARLLNVDERKTQKSRLELRARALVYCLFHTSQFRYLKPRNQTLVSGHTALDDGVPWITYDARMFLAAIIKKNDSVFEYGSGGSTVYFSNQAGQVYSVEHDGKWCEILRKEKPFPKSVTIVLRKPNLKAAAGEIAKYGSNTIKRASFKNYVDEINRFPDEHFDIVFVDGRARSACVLAAVSKVKAGGYLSLDNSERTDYQKAIISLKGWEEKSFYGVGPFELHLWQTSFWKKPAR